MFSKSIPKTITADDKALAHFKTVSDLLFDKPLNDFSDPQVTIKEVFNTLFPLISIDFKGGSQIVCERTASLIENNKDQDPQVLAKLNALFSFFPEVVFMLSPSVRKLLRLDFSWIKTEVEKNLQKSPSPFIKVKLPDNFFNRDVKEETEFNKENIKSYDCFVARVEELNALLVDSYVDDATKLLIHKFIREGITPNYMGVPNSVVDELESLLLSIPFSLRKQAVLTTVYKQLKSPQHFLIDAITRLLPLISEEKERKMINLLLDLRFLWCKFVINPYAATASLEIQNLILERSLNPPGAFNDIRHLAEQADLAFLKRIFNKLPKPTSVGEVDTSVYITSLLIQKSPFEERQAISHLNTLLEPDQYSVDFYDVTFLSLIKIFPVLPFPMKMQLALPITEEYFNHPRFETINFSKDERKEGDERIKQFVLPELSCYQQIGFLRKMLHTRQQNKKGINKEKFKSDISFFNGLIADNMRARELCSTELMALEASNRTIFPSGVMDIVEEYMGFVPGNR